MSLVDIIKESDANKPVVFFVLSSDIVSKAYSVLIRFKINSYVLIKHVGFNYVYFLKDVEVVMSDLAHGFGMSEKYRVISLGQGQGPVATQLIIDAAKLVLFAFYYIKNNFVLASHINLYFWIVNHTHILMICYLKIPLKMNKPKINFLNLIYAHKTL